MSGAVGGSPIASFLRITADEQSAVSTYEAGSVASQRSVAHFTAAAATIATPQALLKDYRSLGVVLGAFGMSSMIGETAIIAKLMTQDPSSSTSLAQTSGNALWQRFAKNMSGWTSTTTPLQSASNVSAISSQYLTNQYETAQGDSTPGMQQALYFGRTMNGKATLNTIMSDPTQLNVVETVSGLDPMQFGALDFTQQQAILTKAIDLSSFSTPAGIRRYTEQYLAMTAANPPSSAPTYSVATLFGASDGSTSLFSIIGTGLTASV
jgi:hypothetical protein